MVAIALRFNAIPNDHREEPGQSYSESGSPGSSLQSSPWTSMIGVLNLKNLKENLPRSKSSLGEESFHWKMSWKTSGEQS